MRNKPKRRTILIDGIRYYDDKPKTCRQCFFWKNRKAGCILGEQNCYYLAETVKTEQEKKCEGCCYAKGQPCVSAVCYKELDRWLQATRANRAKKAGAASLHSLRHGGKEPRMTFTKDERTLILLYYEDDRATTFRSPAVMQGQLQPDEKELCALTGLVLDRLSSMTDQEFQRLDLFGETG